MAGPLGSRGILIAIEGIDGAGKTLQTEMLTRRLQVAGLDVVRTKEPTNGHVHKMREAIERGERLSAEEEMMIFLDDRREHVEKVIGPALADGKVVILDRYYFSNAAYQGSRGLDPNKILAENEKFAPQPDLLVILDTPVEESLHRIHRRGNGRSLFEEPETLEMCRRVFLEIKRDYRIVVDGMRSPSEIHEAIVKRLDEGALFRRLCLKPYLDRCEPYECGFRLDGSCEWIKLGGLRRAAPVDPVIA